MTTKVINSLLQRVLSEFSLGETDLNVYLATLSLGTAPASKIAKKAGLNRVTTYQALKRLAENGLANTHTKQSSSVQYFQVDSIDTLIAKLEEKQSKIQAELDELHTHKQALHDLYDHTFASPEVALYTGKEGVKTVIMDTLAERPKETLSFASGSSLLAFDDNFTQDYYNKRVALKIPTKGIIPGTEAVKKRWTKDINQKELRQLRYISPKLDHLEHEIEIYGNNVAFMSMKKNAEHGIIIRSKTISDALREIFHILWERLEQ